MTRGDISRSPSANGSGSSAPPAVKSTGNLRSPNQGCPDSRCVIHTLADVSNATQASLTVPPVEDAAVVPDEVSAVEEFRKAPVDESFMEDEMQAVLGMGGQGQGNRAEMAALGGTNANQTLAGFTKSLPGLDLGPIDLEARMIRAITSSLTPEPRGLLDVVGGDGAVQRAGGASDQPGQDRAGLCAGDFNAGGESPLGALARGAHLSMGGRGSGEHRRLRGLQHRLLRGGGQLYPHVPHDHHLPSSLLGLGCDGHVGPQLPRRWHGVLSNHNLSL